MNITDFVSSELLCLVPVLNVLGYIIKHKSGIGKNLIPFILMGVGVFLSFLYLWGKGDTLFTTLFSAVTQGILLSALAVFGNQLYKNYKETKGEDNN